MIKGRPLKVTLLYQRLYIIIYKRFQYSQLDNKKFKM